MGWLGRERRRGPRRPGSEPERKSEPTYIVERDAPHGYPQDPMARWTRRAMERVKRRIYDAYPDHARPFSAEDAELHAARVDADGAPAPLDPVVKERLPQPAKGPPIRVVVFRGRKGRAVSIEPFRWDRPDLWPRSFLFVIGNAVAATLDKLRKGDDAQGLAEYSLILALIAIIAIVTLLFIGTQISGILNNLGTSI